MTRNDYELIARAFRESIPVATLAPDDLPRVRQGWATAAHAVADMLAAGNARFDRTRFLAACGVTGA